MYTTAWVAKHMYCLHLDLGARATHPAVTLTLLGNTVRFEIKYDSGIDCCLLGAGMCTQGWTNPLASEYLQSKFGRILLHRTKEVRDEEVRT